MFGLSYFNRVFGTKGLRVVDGSVFQEREVSVNQCTCQMLGSVASEIILDYWEDRPSYSDDDDDNVISNTI